MERRLFVGAAMVLLAGMAVGQAQAPVAGQRGGPPAAGAGRGGGRGPAVVSPEVGADRTITFRFVAPNAQKITVGGELNAVTLEMSKGENGVWTATTPPMPPDVYTYSFNVDGVTALDPRNTNTKMGYGGFGPVSTVEVPGDGPQFYDVKDVPHGAVRIQPYMSKSMGLAREMWIYTPPGYDKGKDFPVMYLLHGAGDIESGWTLIGRANNILDNLIAEGKAKPMVVVMPLGHAIQSFYAGPAKNAAPVTAAAAPARDAAGPAGAAGAAAAPAAGGGGRGAAGPAALSQFGHDLLEDVMPFIEKTMKVSTKADDRAIAGLSMGGGQTENIAFTRPDLFRYVVIMSGAVQGNADTAYPKFFSDVAMANKQFKLLWVGVGKDDALVGNGVKAFEATLTAKGVNHKFVVGEGRHEWTVWRHNLNDVAPLLFR